MHHRIRVDMSDGWKHDGINAGIMPEVLRIAYDNAKVLLANYAIGTVVFAAIQTSGGSFPVWIHVEKHGGRDDVVIEFGPMFGKRETLVFTCHVNAGVFEPEASNPRWTITDIPYGPQERDDFDDIDGVDDDRI